MFYVLPEVLFLYQDPGKGSGDLYYLVCVGSFRLGQFLRLVLVLITLIVVSSVGYTKKKMKAYTFIHGCTQMFTAS
jgi:hypothetical protein